MKLHQRTMHVQGATAEIGMALLHWDGQDDLDIHDRLMLLVQYQHDLTRRLVDLPPLHRGQLHGLDDLLDSAQRAHELTNIEMLRLVIGEVYGLTKYLLRQERHPNNPEAKADEAADDD